MLNIVVNGKPLEFAPGSTVAAVIEKLAVSGRYAVEVNQAIVPRSLHANTLLQPGDCVEIVQAIGGG